MSFRFPKSARERAYATLTSTPVRTLAWLALASATGLLVRAEAVRPDGPGGVRVSTDLVYRETEGRRVRLDVYEPDEDAPARRPAVLALHGGGWRGGSKAEYGRSVASLTRAGLVVFAVEYRLSRPDAPAWPGNLDDVREALRWVRGHVAEYRIDPDRVAVLGASAGGHLALLLGSLPGRQAPVNAVIDFYGPTDLRVLHDRRTRADRAIYLLLGGTPATVPGLYDAASPIRQIAKGGPPVLIVHGDDDALVPHEQSRAMAAALASLGVPSKLLTVHGARHGFGLVSGDRDLVPEIVAFLNGVWGEWRGGGSGGADPREESPRSGRE